MRKTILTVLAALLSIGLSAQQVTTLYFLENAPMRHTINPAFQPASKGFFNFSPLGWMSVSAGNNSFTMSDLIFYDPISKSTITALHPNADKSKFLGKANAVTLANSEVTIGLLNFGGRVKENGYYFIGFNERIIGGATLPQSIFSFLLDGGMTDLTGVNTFNLRGTSGAVMAYAEASGGYSHKIDEKWTIGGKIKILLGHAYAKYNTRSLTIDASMEEWHMQGDLGMNIAGSVNTKFLNATLNNRNMLQIVESFQDGSFRTDSLFESRNVRDMVFNSLAPAGYGAAFDLGLTYKPIKNLQISAALMDLGLIYWTKGNSYSCKVDTTFTGVGYIDYGDPAYRNADGQFSSEMLLDTVKTRMLGLLAGVRMKGGDRANVSMPSARLNLGIDANFWNNRVGVGIVSATRLYNARLYEEITIGAALRPTNWLNLAFSYSLMNNGQYSNFGAGLSFMPYDGINLTLAMDYIPTSYAGIEREDGQKLYVIPDKTKMFNLAMGFSVVWGTNRKDSDKDGVWDKLDMCKNTPRGVPVSENGCPKDSDGDGIPDYKDNCPDTPAEHIKNVNSNGCTNDSDGDGVPDYKDECSSTPREAAGKVDDKGCPTDSDEDGVADYKDECPGTPKEAAGKVDAKGCPKDTDGDGVADYLDRCPGTPAEAAGHVDEKGCPLDSDKDGVPDYKDKCPDTPAKAARSVNADGCEPAAPAPKKEEKPAAQEEDWMKELEQDSDNDGVPDIEDECPTSPGTIANNGCPEIKKETFNLLAKAMRGIEFESGKAVIKAKSYAILDQVAQLFIENPGYHVEIQGHTDNTGKADANLKLSEQRAQEVKKYLVKKGVPAEHMTAHGYGQEQPIADNSTAEGRQKNRRVEFKISFE